MGPEAREAVPALIRALDDDDPLFGVGPPAASALASIGPAAVPLLTRALGDRSARVRMMSAMALEVLGADARDAVPAMIVALNTPDTEVRIAVLRAIASVGIPARDAETSLTPLLDDPNGRIRYQARKALRQIAEESESPPDP